MYAAQGDVAHQAALVLLPLVDGGENAVGHHIDVAVLYAAGAHNAEHGLLHPVNLRAALQQDFAGQPGKV